MRKIKEIAEKASDPPTFTYHTPHGHKYQISEIDAEQTIIFNSRGGRPGPQTRKQTHMEMNIMVWGGS